MYLVIGTRPDLAYTVSALSQFSSQPTAQHMGILKQVLQYLKSTRNLTLTYKNLHASDVTLSGYSDFDYGGDRNNWKSTLGNIFQIAGNTISWWSVKQQCVSTSTVEAEYIALSTTAKQQIWLQNALAELRLDSEIPAALHTDNIGAIDLTSNLHISDKSKHINIAYHHIRDLVENGIINLLHVPSEDNLADICTKPLPLPRFCTLRDDVLRSKG